MKTGRFILPVCRITTYNPAYKPIISVIDDEAKSESEDIRDIIFYLKGVVKNSIKERLRFYLKKIETQSFLL